jgi:hypothetical protein
LIQKVLMFLHCENVFLPKVKNTGHHDFHRINHHLIDCSQKYFNLPEKTHTKFLEKISGFSAYSGKEILSI